MVKALSSSYPGAPRDINFKMTDHLYVYREEDFTEAIEKAMRAMKLMSKFSGYQLALLMAETANNNDSRAISLKAAQQNLDQIRADNYVVESLARRRREEQGKSP
jgi:hypothetical protein